MDLFPKNTGAAGTGGTGVFNTKGLVMGYYDGNTVTAMWNYAQHFAMSDNSYSSTFGPSTPGAVNLISGQTNGVVGFAASNGTNPGNTINNIVADGQGGFTMYGDSDPHGDVCSSTTSPTTEMTGKNIGDLLNARGHHLGLVVWAEAFNLHGPRTHQRHYGLQAKHVIADRRLRQRDRLCPASCVVPVLSRHRRETSATPGRHRSLAIN